MNFDAIKNLKSNKIINLKHILIMFIPLICEIIIHMIYMKLSPVFLDKLSTLLAIKYIIPLIIGLIVSIIFIKSKYNYNEKCNFKVILLCTLSLVISYGIVSFLSEYIIRYINISITILNYLIDGIEVLIIYFLVKLLCQNEDTNSKTVALTILFISIIEFIIRAKRSYLYLFFQEFGFSYLSIMQIISILSSIVCTIVPGYAMSLYKELKK